MPQVTQRNFDFDPRAPNASSDKNLCLSHGSNHFCTNTPPDKCFHNFEVECRDSLAFFSFQIATATQTKIKTKTIYISILVFGCNNYL